MADLDDVVAELKKIERLLAAIAKERGVVLPAVKKAAVVRRKGYGAKPLKVPPPQ